MDLITQIRTLKGGIARQLENADIEIARYHGNITRLQQEIDKNKTLLFNTVQCRDGLKNARVVR